MKQLKYFFEHETFGPDFWRREGPADVTILAPIAAEVNNGHPVPYGFNAPNGTYITDVPPQTNFVSPPALPSQSYVSLKLDFQPCDGYKALMTTRVPAVLLNTTGILKQNVDTLVQAIYQPLGSFGKCELSLPGGPANT